MKFVKKIFFLILMCLCCNRVFAECNSQKIDELKTKAEDIDIYFSVGESEETDLGMSAPPIDVYIEGLTSEFYVIDPVEQIAYSAIMANDGIIKIPGYFSGRQDFKIYSVECSSLIKTVSLSIPRYNIYASDPLCENISGEDLDVCDEWYEGELTYDNFKDKVNKYNSYLESTQKTEEGENVILTFFAENYIYFISAIIIVLIVTIIVIINKRRGALE